MHLSHNVFIGFDTCKSLCSFAYWFYLCVFYIAVQRVRKPVEKGLQACDRKKGMFDEAVQTQAKCIIQWVKNMHL